MILLALLATVVSHYSGLTGLFLLGGEIDDPSQVFLWYILQWMSKVLFPEHSSNKQQQAVSLLRHPQISPSMTKKLSASCEGEVNNSWQLLSQAFCLQLHRLQTNILVFFALVFVSSCFFRAAVNDFQHKNIVFLGCFVNRDILFYLIL